MSKESKVELIRDLFEENFLDEWIEKVIQDEKQKGEKGIFQGIEDQEIDFQFLNNTIFEGKLNQEKLIRVILKDIGNEIFISPVKDIDKKLISSDHPEGLKSYTKDKILQKLVDKFKIRQENTSNNVDLDSQKKAILDVILFKAKEIYLYFDDYLKNDIDSTINEVYEGAQMHCDYMINHAQKSFLYAILNKPYYTPNKASIREKLIKPKEDELYERFCAEILQDRMLPEGFDAVDWAKLLYDYYDAVNIFKEIKRKLEKSPIGNEFEKWISISANAEEKKYCIHVVQDLINEPTKPKLEKPSWLAALYLIRNRKWDNNTITVETLLKNIIKVEKALIHRRIIFSYYTPREHIIKLTDKKCKK